MRKKPPAEIPNVNAGTPWSDMDVDDLFEMLSANMPVPKIADYLCREVAEVEAKIAEIGHQRRQ